MRWTWKRQRADLRVYKHVRTPEQDLARETLRYLYTLLPGGPGDYWHMDFSWFTILRQNVDDGGRPFWYPEVLSGAELLLLGLPVAIEDGVFPRLGP